MNATLWGSDMASPPLLGDDDDLVDQSLFDGSLFGGMDRFSPPATVDSPSRYQPPSVSHSRASQNQNQNQNAGAMPSRTSPVRHQREMSLAQTMHEPLTEAGHYDHYFRQNFVRQDWGEFGLDSPELALKPTDVGPGAGAGTGVDPSVNSNDAMLNLEDGSSLFSPLERQDLDSHGADSRHIHDAPRGHYGAVTIANRQQSGEMIEDAFSELSQQDLHPTLDVRPAEEDSYREAQAMTQSAAVQQNISRNNSKTKNGPGGPQKPTTASPGSQTPATKKGKKSSASAASSKPAASDAAPAPGPSSTSSLTPTAPPAPATTTATGRRRISKDQTEVMEASFKIEPRPSKEERDRIVKITGLKHRNVQIWFQNRRAKARVQNQPAPENTSLARYFATRDDRGASTGTATATHPGVDLQKMRSRSNSAQQMHVPLLSNGPRPHPAQVHPQGQNQLGPMAHQQGYHHMTQGGVEPGPGSGIGAVVAHLDGQQQPGWDYNQFGGDFEEQKHYYGRELPHRLPPQNLSRGPVLDSRAIAGQPHRASMPALSRASSFVRSRDSSQQGAGYPPDAMVPPSPVGMYSLPPAPSAGPHSQHAQMMQQGSQRISVVAQNGPPYPGPPPASPYRRQDPNRELWMPSTGPQSHPQVQNQNQNQNQNYHGWQGDAATPYMYSPAPSTPLLDGAGTEGSPDMNELVSPVFNASPFRGGNFAAGSQAGYAWPQVGAPEMGPAGGPVNGPTGGTGVHRNQGKPRQQFSAMAEMGGGLMQSPRIVSHAQQQLYAGREPLNRSKSAVTLAQGGMHDELDGSFKRRKSTYRASALSTPREGSFSDATTPSSQMSPTASPPPGSRTPMTPFDAVSAAQAHRRLSGRSRSYTQPNLRNPYMPGVPDGEPAKLTGSGMRLHLDDQNPHAQLVMIPDEAVTTPGSRPPSAGNIRYPGANSAAARVRRMSSASQSGVSPGSSPVHRVTPLGASPSVLQGIEDPSLARRSRPQFDMVPEEDSYFNFRLDP